MGAESSVLEGCHWEPHIDCPPKFPWEISPVRKPDGTLVTVFEAKASETKQENFLRKSAAILRGLRHPNIIRFIGSGESSSGFWLATESVLPVYTVVSELSSGELCVGLFDLLQGLDFLHSKLGLCHNSICLNSVYVSSDGTWKLGGLELACRFTDVSKDFIERYRTFRPDLLSPEDKAGHVRTDAALGHARDVFAFGTLADILLDSIKEKDNCAQLLEQQLRVCLSSDPVSRPQVSTLLSLSVFRCDLIEILQFLRHVTAKSDYEKKEFFSSLMPRLRALPEAAIARRLVVPLLSRFVLLNEWADVHVLPHVLMPRGPSSKKSSASMQGLLSEHLFRQYVINHIYSIFHVYDSHVRLLLLEHFSHYVGMFTRQQLEDDIFLQVLLGIRDIDDRLVSASLRALADLVPLLGGDYVVGGVRKPFFFHGIPKMAHENQHEPHSMMDILANNKPLLKDLAETSNKKMSVERSLVEKEKRVIEREQRREDARLRREERKEKILKEKQTDSDKEAVQAGTVGQMLGLTIEQVADLDADNMLLKAEKSVDNSDGTPNNVTANSDLDLERKSPDWSDWEDVDEKISDEVELELRSMSSTVFPADTKPKVQTSPSPYRSRSPPSPPSVKVDWSDVPEIHKDIDAVSDKDKRVPGSRGVGLLHLAAKSNKKNDRESVEDKERNRSEQADADMWDSDSSEVRSGHRQKGTESSARTVAQKLVKNKRHAHDLSAGLDIKSLIISEKPTPPELDFFADMTPSITASKSSGLLSLVESSTVVSLENPASSHVGPSKTQEGQMIRNSAMFAVSAVSEEEVKGWGEDTDLDWKSELMTDQ